MKNVFGKKEDLELYNKEGKIVYRYVICSDGWLNEYTYDSFGNELTYKNSDGYSSEYTRDSKGNKLTYKNSDGHTAKWTRDSDGNELTYEDSNGYSCEYTYDSFGKELTYKNSDGERRGFNIPEYTTERLVEILKEKIGEFKVVVKWLV